MTCRPAQSSWTRHAQRERPRCCWPPPLQLEQCSCHQPRHFNRFQKHEAQCFRIRRNCIHPRTVRRLHWVSSSALCRLVAGDAPFAEQDILSADPAYAAMSNPEYSPVDISACKMRPLRSQIHHKQTCDSCCAGPPADTPGRKCVTVADKALLRIVDPQVWPPNAREVACILLFGTNEHTPICLICITMFAVQLGWYAYRRRARVEVYERIHSCTGRRR